jgi:spore maturation protein CgeB
MRIFTAVRHSNNPTYYYGGLWSRNFYPALLELGHEIVESQVDLFPTSRFMHIDGNFTRQESEVRACTTEKIIDEVTRAHRQKPIDLFLSYFYNAHFDPAGFDRLRNVGIPSINFYCNSIYQFDHVRAIAAKADISWHTEKNALEAYLAVGAHPLWVQMGADPKVYQPVANVSKTDGSLLY